MARFLFCLPRYHTNAVPWVRILKEGGHSVAVHTITRGKTENYSLLEPVVLQPSWISKRISPHLPSGVNEPYSFPSVRRYWRLMASEDPDIVIIRDVTRWFSSVALVCAIGQRRQVLLYDQEDFTPPRWSSTSVRRSFFRAFGIPHMTVRLPKKGDKPHCGSAIALPFGSPFPPDSLLGTGNRAANWPPRILMVAKYRERKGHRLLMSALAKLAPDLEFSVTFCGSVESETDADFCRSLQQLATEQGLSNRIQYRNNVHHTKMAELYQEHEVFILPSHREPAAISPIEAAWSGCFVLVSQDTGNRGYVPAKPEFEFDAQDPNDIARAISNAISSPKTLEIGRTLCRQFIASIASPDRILNQFESFIR